MYWIDEEKAKMRRVQKQRRSGQKQIVGVRAVNVFPCLLELNVCVATIGNSKNATYSTSVDVTGEKAVPGQYIRLSGSCHISCSLGKPFFYLSKTNWKGQNQYEGQMWDIKLILAINMGFQERFKLFRNVPTLSIEFNICGPFHKYSTLFFACLSGGPLTLLHFWRRTIKDPWFSSIIFSICFILVRDLVNSWIFVYQGKNSS